MQKLKQTELKPDENKYPETKEYIQPKGRYIYLNFNICIVILVVWWIVIYGIGVFFDELETKFKTGDRDRRKKHAK